MYYDITTSKLHVANRIIDASNDVTVSKTLDDVTKELFSGFSSRPVVLDRNDYWNIKLNFSLLSSEKVQTSVNFILINNI